MSRQLNWSKQRIDSEKKREWSVLRAIRSSTTAKHKNTSRERERERRPRDVHMEKNKEITGRSEVALVSSQHNSPIRKFSKQAGRSLATVSRRNDWSSHNLCDCNTSFFVTAWKPSPPRCLIHPPRSGLTHVRRRSVYKTKRSRISDWMIRRVIKFNFQKKKKKKNDNLF